MAEAWPSVLKPNSFGFWPENVSRTGGLALNGAEQTIASGAGRWRAGGVFPVRTNEQVLAARAFFAKVQGRAVEILLPAFDGKRANWPLERLHGYLTGRTLHPGVSRNKRMDGTAYEDQAIPSVSEIIATAGNDRSVGAVQMQIDLSQGDAIKVGQYFSVANRLHLITSIVSTSGTITTVAFWPPLRVAVSTGATVQFSRPTCTVKLLSDDSVMHELEGLRFADLALEFRESV